MAVARVALNAKAVARFAARGALPRGSSPKPVSAPLSDPSAEEIVQEQAAAAADAAIRRALLRLLPSDEREEDEGTGSEKKHDAAVGIASMQYLQRRVGVPRDMPLEAARWLRAALG